MALPTTRSLGIPRHSLSTWKEKTEILKLRAEEEIRSDLESIGSLSSHIFFLSFLPPLPGLSLFSFYLLIIHMCT